MGYESISNIIAWLSSEPLAVLPSAFEAIKTVVLSKGFDPVQYASLKAASSVNKTPAQNYSIDENGILTVHVSGELVSRTVGLNSSQSGLLSYDDIRTVDVLAMTDDRVKGVMKVYDSPGGAVQGLVESVNISKELLSKKPVYTYVLGTMASAALWQGVVAKKCFASPSSAIGSIGVFWPHFDMSKKFEKEGVTVTLQYAGSHKIDGNSFEPLQDSVKAERQKKIDETYRQFMTHVSEMRGLSLDKSSDWADGKMFTTDEAKAVGLIDDVVSYEDAYAMLLKDVGIGVGISSIGIPAQEITDEKQARTESQNAKQKKKMDALTQKVAAMYGKTAENVTEDDFSAYFEEQFKASQKAKAEGFKAKAEQFAGLVFAELNDQAIKAGHSATSEAESDRKAKVQAIYANALAIADATGESEGFAIIKAQKECAALVVSVPENGWLASGARIDRKPNITKQDKDLSPQSLCDSYHKKMKAHSPYADIV